MSHEMSITLSSMLMKCTDLSCLMKQLDMVVRYLSPDNDDDFISPEEPWTTQIKVKTVIGVVVVVVE